MTLDHAVEQTPSRFPGSLVLCRMKDDRIASAEDREKQIEDSTDFFDSSDMFLLTDKKR